MIKKYPQKTKMLAVITSQSGTTDQLKRKSKPGIRYMSKNSFRKGGIFRVVSWSFLTRTSVSAVQGFF